jgi:hypothetical protein
MAISIESLLVGACALAGIVKTEGEGLGDGSCVCTRTVAKLRLMLPPEDTRLWIVLGVKRPPYLGRPLSWTGFWPSGLGVNRSAAVRSQRLAIRRL